MGPRFFAVCVFILYFGASLLWYFNELQTERIGRISVTNSFALQKLRLPYFYDAVYFRTLAEKLQFLKHDPAVVDRCYQLSLKKGPADYKNYLSYARYLSGRNCCLAKLESLLESATRLSRNNPETQLVAGETLLQAAQKRKAVAYLKRSIELGGTLPSSLYSRIATDDEGREDLINLASSNSKTLLSVARYFEKKDEKGYFRRTLTELSQFSLEPSIRIALAKLAVKGGELSIGRDQALLAMNDKESHLPALQLLAEIAVRENDLAEYEKLVREIETSGGKAKAQKGRIRKNSRS